MLLSIGFLALLADAVAQDQPPTAFPVEPGQRIRLAVADASMTGTFISQSSETQYLAVSTWPSRSRPWRLRGAISTSGESSRQTECSDWGCALGEAYLGIAEEMEGPMIGGMVGMLARVAVGLIHRSDKWETVPAGRVLVSVAPHGAGVGISARIAF